jgi:hypothetical protein
MPRVWIRDKTGSLKKKTKVQKSCEAVPLFLE